MRESRLRAIAAGVYLSIYFLSASAQKGGFQGPAAKEGIAILFPDTSPRGAGIEGETDDWDFGVGMLSPRELVSHEKPHSVTSLRNSNT